MHSLVHTIGSRMEGKRGPSALRLSVSVSPPTKQPPKDEEEEGPPSLLLLLLLHSISVNGGGKRRRKKKRKREASPPLSPPTMTAASGPRRRRRRGEIDKSFPEGKRGVLASYSPLLFCECGLRTYDIRVVTAECPIFFLLFTSGSTPSYRVRIGSGKPSHFFSRPFFARAKLGPTPHRQSGSRGSLSSSLERGRIALAPEQVKTIGWLGTEKTKEEWSLQNKASFLAPSVAACKYSVGYLSPLAKSIHRRPRIIPSPFTKVRLILANSRLIPYRSSSQPFFGSAPPSPISPPRGRDRAKEQHCFVRANGRGEDAFQKSSSQLLLSPPPNWTPLPRLLTPHFCYGGLILRYDKHDPSLAFHSPRPFHQSCRQSQRWCKRSANAASPSPHTWAPPKFQQGGQKNSFREGDYKKRPREGDYFQNLGYG